VKLQAKRTVSNGKTKKEMAETNIMELEWIRIGLIVVVNYFDDDD
jgi:hypothetical protein